MYPISIVYIYYQCYYSYLKKFTWTIINYDPQIIPTKYVNVEDWMFYYLLVEQCTFYFKYHLRETYAENIHHWTCFLRILKLRVCPTLPLKSKIKERNEKKNKNSTANYSFLLFWFILFNYTLLNKPSPSSISLLNLNDLYVI